MEDKNRNRDEWEERQQDEDARETANYEQEKLEQQGDRDQQGEE
jgi:hypothetical protein